MSPAPLPVSQCGSVVPMCCRLRQSVVVRGENCGVAWLASLVMALPRKGRSSLLREIIRSVVTIRYISHLTISNIYKQLTVVSQI